MNGTRAAKEPAARPRVLLTRSEEDCAAWAEALERRGIAAVALPCITAEPFDSPALAAELRRESALADWLVFTSRRGVEGYARLVGGDVADATRIAVVGPATADAARSLFGRVDLIGEDGTAEGLALTIIDNVRAPGAEAAARAPARKPSNPRVLLALAENARATLEHKLTEAGMHCVRLNVYRTVPAAPAAQKRALASFGVDAVLLASPSAVSGFVNQVELDGSARLVAIGPSTGKAAKALGLEVAARAREPSLEGLLEALSKLSSDASSDLSSNPSSGWSSNPSSSDSPSDLSTDSNSSSELSETLQ